MVRLFGRKKYGPIGIDLGSRAIKLVQFDVERSKVWELSRVDFPARGGEELAVEKRGDRLAEALRRARDGKNFKGRDCVVCLGNRELFLQNIRVPKVEDGIERLVQQEAAARVPFPLNETELRFFEAADVRQGEAVMREVILLACHRPVLDDVVDQVVAAGLRPRAVDIEPAALMRSYVLQYRREEDRQKRALFVHLGYSKTAVVIAQGDEVLFIKYIPLGGRQLDEAVGRHLNMSLVDACALRRQNGDRRAGQQDPELSRSLAKAMQPTIEQIGSELSKCVRYHSVTFRGRTIAQLVLGGGEATPQLLEILSKQLELKGDMSDPFRGDHPGNFRPGQWDVAAGLALRDQN